MQFGHLKALIKDLPGDMLVYHYDMNGDLKPVKNIQYNSKEKELNLNSFGKDVCSVQDIRTQLFTDDVALLTQTESEPDNLTDEFGLQVISNRLIIGAGNVDELEVIPEGTLKHYGVVVDLTSPIISVEALSKQEAIELAINEVTKRIAGVEDVSVDGADIWYDPQEEED